MVYSHYNNINSNSSSIILLIIRLARIKTRDKAVWSVILRHETNKCKTWHAFEETGGLSSALSMLTKSSDTTRRRQNKQKSYFSISLVQRYCWRHDKKDGEKWSRWKMIEVKSIFVLTPNPSNPWSGKNGRLVVLSTDHLLQRWTERKCQTKRKCILCTVQLWRTYSRVNLLLNCSERIR